MMAMASLTEELGLERGEKIANLEDAAVDLEMGGSKFKSRTNKLKKKYWEEDRNMTIIMGLLVIGLILLVLIATIWFFLT